MQGMLYRRRAPPPTPKQRWRLLFMALGYVREYFLHTSQGGYKYIVEPGRYLVERVFWAVVVSVAVATSSYIILLQWKFHLSRYTITTLETTYFPIWNVPFPAVTVCDINKIQLSAAKKLANSMQLPEGISEENMVNELGLLIELIESNEKNLSMLEEFQSVLDINNYTIQDVMKMLAPSCERLLLKCRWKGRKINCKDIFIMRKTYEGYCCSFNYRAINNDIVKHAQKLNRMGPMLISSSGPKTGLSVLVQHAPDQYHATVMASFGVKVLLHDSYDYPGMNVVKKLVPIGSELFFSLQPWVTYATSSVRKVDQYKRGWKGCLFHDEMQLNLVKQYSYDNCVMECRSNVSTELCGCSPFYYPNDGSQRTCNLSDVPCLAINKQMLQTMYPGANISTDKIEQGPVIYPCNCLPDCSNTYYPTEDYEGELAMKATNSHSMFKEGLNSSIYSVFHVYFGKFMATRYRRTVLYSWQSLLGSFGGLLSLFIGFSLISGFELVYFFTLRIFYKNQYISTATKLHAATSDISGLLISNTHNALENNRTKNRSRRTLRKQAWQGD